MPHSTVHYRIINRNVIMFQNFIIVGLGGAIGSMLRYGVTILSAHLGIFMSGQAATLLVNILGSMLMGWITGMCQQSHWTLFLTMGLCGGFTTFSTFSMQNVKLLEEGYYITAVLYILLTLVLCVTSCIIGYAISSH